MEEELHIARNKKKVILSERAELLRLDQEWRTRLARLEWRTRLARLEMSVLKAVGKQEKRWRVQADVINGQVSFVDVGQSLSEKLDSIYSKSMISENKLIK